MSPASYQTAPPRDEFLYTAGNGTRTRDPNLGKVVLYQLSYSRVDRILASGPTVGNQILPASWRPRFPSSNGGEGDRTPDLVNAIHALSQLSYAPVNIDPPRRRLGRRRGSTET